MPPDVLMDPVLSALLPGQQRGAEGALQEQGLEFNSQDTHKAWWPHTCTLGTGEGDTGESPGLTGWPV